MAWHRLFLAGFGIDVKIMPLTVPQQDTAEGSNFLD
jgi:hypothetical protein